MLIRPFYIRLPEDIGADIVAILKDYDAVLRDTGEDSTIKKVFIPRQGTNVNIRGKVGINTELPMYSLAEFMHEVQIASIAGALPAHE